MAIKKPFAPLGPPSDLKRRTEEAIIVDIFKISNNNVEDYSTFWNWAVRV